MLIDVHNHAIPGSSIDLLNAEPLYGVTVRDGVWRGGVHVPFKMDPSFFRADAKVEELDRYGIDAAIVSVSPTIFYHHVVTAAGERMARVSNEGLAAMADQHPDRLAWMATVPLQDPDRAVTVLQEAVQEGAVGVEIGTAVGHDKRLDHPDLTPFWAAAERLEVPVMLHPAYTVPNPSLDAFYLENVIGFLLETTVAIERLICAGVLDRHPGLRIVLLHAGGYFAWQAPRLRHATTVRPELEHQTRDPWSYVGQVVFDTITHDRDALRYLAERAGMDNVVLGTDLPFDMAPVDPVGLVREACGDAGLPVIGSRNPQRIYPRLKERFQHD